MSPDDVEPVVTVQVEPSSAKRSPFADARVQIQENNLNLNQKVRIQEQHQACLTRWVESGWTDNDAKKQMFELMAVMLSWEGSN